MRIDCGPGAAFSVHSPIYAFCELDVAAISDFISQVRNWEAVFSVLLSTTVRLKHTLSSRLPPQKSFLFLLTEYNLFILFEQQFVGNCPSQPVVPKHFRQLDIFQEVTVDKFFFF